MAYPNNVPIPVNGNVPVAGGQLAPPGGAPIPVAGGYAGVVDYGAQPIPVQGAYSQPQPVYGAPVPVGQPQYANGTQAVAPVPADYGSGNQTGTVEAGSYKFLEQHRRLLIKQRFEALEAIANAIGFEAIEFSNKYDIYDADTGIPIMYAAEESDCLCRACCKPHHKAKVHIFDVRAGVNQPIMVVDKPFKCNCCILHNSCATEQTTLSAQNIMLGGAKQPTPFGGYFTPRLDVFKGTRERNVDYNIVGPFCCVGGQCVESCVDQTFVVNNETGTEKVGRFVKMKPSGMVDQLKQFAGDADNYLLEMDANQSAEQMATLTATLLLMDYIFFENGGGASVENGGVSINIANCYCCGCICPLNASLGGGDGGGY